MDVHDIGRRLREGGYALDREAILEMLREGLTVRLDKDYSGCEFNSVRLSVTLCLFGEEISCDSQSIYDE